MRLFGWIRSEKGVTKYQTGVLNLSSGFDWSTPDDSSSHEIRLTYKRQSGELVLVIEGSKSVKVIDAR